MDIFLSVNNREQVLQLPVVPPEFSITKPKNNNVFETATHGDLKLIGKAGLRGIIIESFFPVRDYPFLRDRSTQGFGYVYIIDTWYHAKLPIRLVITETPINLAMTVDSFDYRIGTNGDLYYTLALSEFPMPNVG